MIAKFIEFVKGQLQFHSNMAKKFSYDKSRSDKHLETANTLRELLDYLEKPVQAAPEPGKPLQLDLTFEEVEGLPPQLLKELSVSEGDKTEFAILKAIREAGGVASLDRLLVSIYKETGEIIKRTTLTSRIYRMSQKDMLYSVPNRKGVYSINPMTAEEAEKLLK